MKNNVLIIDTDLENCKQIKYSLQNTDTEVYYTLSVKEAMELICTHPYTLVIMDILISHTNVQDFITVVRQMNPTPILALSEQASTADKVLALQYGADDYLTKPYDLDECLARAQALMRRYTQLNRIGQRSYVLVGQNPLMIDTARRVVVALGNEVVLTRKEYELLLYLFTNRNLVLSYEQIYQAVWHEDYLGNSDTISFHIRQLRKKLFNCVDIQSSRGVGYCLKLEGA